MVTMVVVLVVGMIILMVMTKMTVLMTAFCYEADVNNNNNVYNNSDDSEWHLHSVVRLPGQFWFSQA